MAWKAYAIGQFPLHCAPGWRNDNWDGRSQWYGFYDYGRFTNEVYKKESDALSALIKEVKPHYKKTSFTAIRVACALFLIVLCGTTFQYANNNYSIVDTIKYGQQFTAEDLGFATDDYGLIMVGE